MRRNQISFAKDRDFQLAVLLPSETVFIAGGSRNGQKRVPVPAGLASPGPRVITSFMELARPCLHSPSSLEAQAPRLPLRAAG